MQVTATPEDAYLSTRRVLHSVTTLTDANDDHFCNRHSYIKRFLTLFTCISRDTTTLLLFKMFYLFSNISTYLVNADTCVVHVNRTKTIFKILLGNRNKSSVIGGTFSGQKLPET